MNKVLIIVGDATETVDTLYPYYRLQEDGFEPVVAAPEKRRYQMVMHEVKPGLDDHQGVGGLLRSRPTSPSRTSSRRNTSASFSAAGARRNTSAKTRICCA